jgi:predicted peptidase
MRRPTVRLMACLAFVACASALPPYATHADEPKPGQQQAEKLKKQVVREVTLDYLLFLPQDYGKEQGKKWPLMLFLHGAGERGSDVNKVKVHGPPKIVQNKKDFPFILVSPQCPENKWWEPEEVVALLDEIQSKYKVDADRVYLTGLSMGGFGTWETATQYPERFAAIAPICGGGRPYTAARLKNIPTWVFHGEKDPVVPIKRSEEMVDALKTAGGDVKFTRYPDAGHDSWTKTYDNPELYEWFLNHTRGQKPEHAAAGK